MFNHLSRPLGIVLAAIVLLAGPPALGSACEDAWNESSASGSCQTPSIVDGVDAQGCTNCCQIAVTCHTGAPVWAAVQHQTNYNFVIRTVEQVKQLQNCHGTLKVGSC